MIVLDNGSVMILLGRTDKTAAPVPFWHTRCIHMIIRDDESIVKIFGTRRQYRPRLVPIQGQLALPLHPFPISPTHPALTIPGIPSQTQNRRNPQTTRDTTKITSSGSVPGFEPGTSCTQSRNHTTRPNGQACLLERLVFKNTLY